MKHFISIQHILGILLGAVFLVGCSGLSAQPTPTEDPFLAEPIQPLVTATGKVVPAEWSRLSFSGPGVVEEILVKKGDLVEDGQMLVRLRGREDLQAAIAAAELELTLAEKDYDDLTKNADDARTAALDRISLLTKAVRDAQYQLDNFTVPTNQANLTTSQALEAMAKRLDAARAAFEPFRYFPSTNSTRKDLKEKLDQAQADYNTAVRRLQYETELEVARTRLADTLDDFETLRAGPDPEDVRVAEARLANAKAALAAARAKLDDLELKAPFAGTVSEVQTRIGEWVTPGEAIILLADLEHLQIETTDLNEIDAARVKVGDAVKITFDALPGLEVEGTVKSLAPKSSEGSGVNFTAVILMDEIPEPLRWGMTAFVDILIE